MLRILEFWGFVVWPSTTFCWICLGKSRKQSHPLGIFGLQPFGFVSYGDFEVGALVSYSFFFFSLGPWIKWYSNACSLRTVDFGCGGFKGFPFFFFVCVMIFFGWVDWGKSMEQSFVGVLWWQFEIWRYYNRASCLLFCLSSLRFLNHQTSSWIS